MAQKIKRISLDIDGVLANFCQAAIEACGREYPAEPFRIPDAWLDEQVPNFWKYCRGHDFWTSLKPFPWTERLVNLVRNNSTNWRLITKPSLDAGAYSGKYQWVVDNLPKGCASHLWIVNGSKSFACGGPGDILIDDNLKNCNEWEAAGGTIYRWTEVSPNWDSKEIDNRLMELQNLLIK